MKGILLLIVVCSSILISGISTENCIKKKLWEENKEWSEQWCEALLERNEMLTKKYGKYWYRGVVYRTIPSNEKETEKMKKLKLDLLLEIESKRENK